MKKTFIVSIILNIILIFLVVFLIFRLNSLSSIISEINSFTDSLINLDSDISTSDLDITVYSFGFSENPANLFPDDFTCRIPYGSPSEGNIFACISYSVKNNGKQAYTIIPCFGSLSFADGYTYSSSSPSGVTVAAKKNLDFPVITDIIQPLCSETYYCCLEVPISLKESVDSPLAYKLGGHTYQIR